MPCDTKLRAGVTPVQRSAQIGSALARLETALTQGRAKVTIDKRTGALAFAGWTPEERDDVTDLCAYRRLSARSSWALRQAVARAETLAGRKVSEQAVSSGLHSHDGGQTFSRH